jgi:hypothetical protein
MVPGVERGGATTGKTIIIYIHMFILKKIFSRTSRLISVKLGTNHPGVKIKNCLNEGPGSHPRGDNHKNANMG